jgi:hypothetical protein
MNRKIITGSRLPWRRRPRLTCESPDCDQPAGSGRCAGDHADGSPATVVVVSGGWCACLCWLEGDVESERFELALQPARAMLGRGALLLPVRTELPERDLVTNDMEVRNKDVVTQRADRFRFSAPSAQLRVVRSEVRALAARGGFR